MNYMRLIVLFLCIEGMADARGNNSRQHTFAMIKPHAVQEGKTEEILEFIKKGGFAIIAMKQIVLTPDYARELYKEYLHCSWFNQYIDSMTVLPAEVVVMILEKKNAMKEWDRYKKVIRSYYLLRHKQNNMVHGSDSIRAAKREIALFFGKDA